MIQENCDKVLKTYIQLGYEMVAETKTSKDAYIDDVIQGFVMACESQKEIYFHIICEFSVPLLEATKLTGFDPCKKNT